MATGPIALELDVVLPAMTFDQVYGDHVDFVWRMVRRLGLSGASADDAAQDVFVVVHRRLSSFEGRGSIRAWLYSITRRVVRDHYRRARRKDPARAPLDGVQASSASPEEGAARSQARQVLAEILHALPEAQREVFVLAELEQMSAPEISAATGIKLNTVYSRLRVARQRFDALVQAWRDQSGRPE